MCLASPAVPYYHRQYVTLNPGFLHVKRVAGNIHVHGKTRQYRFRRRRIGHLVWRHTHGAASLEQIRAAVDQIDTPSRFTTRHRLVGH